MSTPARDQGSIAPAANGDRLVVPPVKAQLLELPETYSVQLVPNSGRHLVIIPRAEFSFAEFCERTPHRSIGLDGLIKDPPARNLTSRHFNFNHHGGVDRAFTLCTADQVNRSVGDGLMRLLLVNDSPEYRVFLNDPDPDSAFASFQLLYPHLCDNVPFRRMLGGFVAPLDVSAGTRGPALDSELMWLTKCSRG